MLKKVITYVDFDENERTEAFYFNLTEAELANLELTHPGGYGDYLDKIVKAKDRARMIELFKELIHMSYGVKSDDGKRFVKSPEALNDFVSTNAYSDLFMELASDDEAAANFVNGILPKRLLAQAKAQQSNIVELPAQ